MSLETYITRILICFILSICVGLERQYRHKTVGLRTNVLVCLGSFMFVSMSFKIVNPDMTRIAAQVVSGIGFLGAGIILKDSNRIKGLNTAATLWCVSSIGILTAAGMLIEATIGTLFILISNIILRAISKKIMDRLKTQENCIITINCDYNEENSIKSLVINLINKYNLNLQSYNKIINKDNTAQIDIDIISSDKFYTEEIMKKITSSANINSLNIKHNKLINSDNEDIEEE